MIQYVNDIKDEVIAEFGDDEDGNNAISVDKWVRL